MRKVVKENYAIQPVYQWQKTAHILDEEDVHFSSQQEAEAAAIKAFEEGERHALVIVKKIAIVKDKNKEVEPDIVVETCDE